MTHPVNYIRGETIRRLNCRHCGGRLLIVPSGMLVCEHALEKDCGRLVPLFPVVPPRFSLADLRRAYPERIITPAESRPKADFKNAG